VPCLWARPADNSCKGDPVALTYAQTKDNINFYHSPADQSYNNEEIYTVTSYAEDGAVLAQRQFNLRQK